MELSPSGNVVVPSSGPDDAKIVLVVDSPGLPEVEKAEALLGRGGKVFRAAAKSVSIDPVDVKIINIVPSRAPKDKFELHSEEDLAWGLGKLRDELRRLRPEAVVLAGGNALRYVGGFGKAHSIMDWRGSQMQAGELRARPSMKREDFIWLAGAKPLAEIADETWIVPTLHPSAVARQYKWHPLLMADLAKVRKLAGGQYPEIAERRWFFNDKPALSALRDRLYEPTSHRGVLAFDTESWPYYIVGLAIEDEVHVFEWREDFRELTESIFACPAVIKVAHNLQHDLTFLWKRLQIKVAQPWYDTMGGAHDLNNSMDKALSPDIATRYTNWSYHKWMVENDPLWYNGLDNVVAYDAYQPQIDQLFARDLYDVAKHDHQLLEPLLDMQWYGFKVDSAAQATAAVELKADRDDIGARIAVAVAPIIDAKLARFKKPKLFEKQVRCAHCGGGKVAAAHCWRCAGLEAKPRKKGDYQNAIVFGHGALVLGADPIFIESTKASVLRKALPACAACNGTGKVTKRLEFNPDSSDQVADVLYRGLGIRPRKYKGAETIRVGQLEPLADEYPLVKLFVEYARANADYETVNRLEPGDDGRLHCVFDPFGTASGRVASKEGLVEKGTNAMNIPKKARRLVVPDSDEYIFLYPDMKAVEGRAIAVLSKDKQLIELFNDEKTDIHMFTRDDMRALGSEFALFSRGQGKRMLFATAYGAQAKQLTVELNDEGFGKEGMTTLTVQLTQAMIDYLLSHRFKGIRGWHDSVERELLANRRVTCPTGRQRIWNEYIYDKRTKGIKNEIAKQAWSACPQDIGAWVLADGMLKAYHSDLWERYRGLIHVHDALLFQALRKDEEEAKHVLTTNLSEEKWGMKFLTEMKTGRNWYEAS